VNAPGSERPVELAGHTEMRACRSMDRDMVLPDPAVASPLDEQ